MKQKTQMPWLPSRGFDQLAIEAYQRGVWEDLGMATSRKSRNQNNRGHYQ